MKKFAYVFLLIMVGVGIGLGLNRADPPETALEHALKHQDPGYICPMHSEIVSSEAGSCPICGMDLVPIRTEEASDEEVDSEHPVVRVPSMVINNLGVRVAQVERKTLVSQIETPGFVQLIRKQQITRFIAPAKGSVEKLHFIPGQWIEKGQPLVDILLDDLVRVQKKHLALLASEKAGAVKESTAVANETGGVDGNGAQSAVADDAGADGKTGGRAAAAGENDADAKAQHGGGAGDETGDETVAAKDPSAKPARKKLTTQDTRMLLLRAGMTEAQIEQLEKTGETSSRITLYSDQPGMVQDLKVKEGDKLRASQFMFTYGGLARVTVLANAFQRDAGSIQPGQPVDIIIPGEGSEPFRGVVSQGAVSINNTSQNIGVKLMFTAPLPKVTSGMYVIGRISTRVSEDTLSVPREAVIYTQKEQRVIEALGGGRFRPVVVKTGVTTNDRVEILEGLEEGDTIVVSAQFLIDSESSLQASYRRMSGVE